MTVVPAREGHILSRVTAWRILKAHGKVVSQSQKRPRSSWQRFTADRPNELWQSDFTHALLADGTDLEVIVWLDDYSRYLLHPSAHRRVPGRTVTDTFTTTAAEHGYPAATLTDNGTVYTTRYACGGRGRGDGTGSAFKTLLTLHVITQKTANRSNPPLKARSNASGRR